MKVKPHRFIVVDDDSMNNLIVKFMLLKFNSEAEIELFLEPEVALETIKQEFSGISGQKPTILFLDLNMPTMSGWEFLDAFERMPAEVRAQFTIFVLSSSIHEGDKRTAEANPLVSGFISKPLTLAILEQIMD